MAQFAGESQTPVASEGILVSVPPTLALAPSVPVPPPLVQVPPLYSVGQWQTLLDPITESILVFATRVPEMPLTPLSQGYVAFDTHPTAATSAIGPPPPGQSMSQSLDSGPPSVLQLSIPTDRSPEVQYQQLMEAA